MYIFYAIILLLPMLAMKRREAGDTGILDAKSTTCIKGILCFYVMFHNLGLDVEGNSEFKELVCEHTGGVGVGLFFFLSAFGIIRSYQKHGNKYLIKLLFVHIPKLYLVTVFINLLTYLSYFRGAFERTDAILRILNLDIFNGLRRINRHGWYIASIILLYVVFAVIYFLCSRLKTDKKFIIAAVLLSLVAIGLRITAKIADEGGMYTREMPTFAIGCIYATFYDKINALAKKYYTPVLIVSVTAFALGFLFFEPIATYAAALIIITVSQKYTYYSSVTHFFGKICIGVYLYLHYSSIVMQGFISNEYMWVLTNAGFIIELAVLTYAVEIGIVKLIGLIRTKLHKGAQEKINEEKETVCKS